MYCICIYVSTCVPFYPNSRNIPQKCLFTGLNPRLEANEHVHPLLSCHIHKSKQWPRQTRARDYINMQCGTMRCFCLSATWRVCTCVYVCASPPPTPPDRGASSCFGSEPLSSSALPFVYSSNTNTSAFHAQVAPRSCATLSDTVPVPPPARR